MSGLFLISFWPGGLAMHLGFTALLAHTVLSLHSGNDVLTLLFQLLCGQGVVKVAKGSTNKLVSDLQVNLFVLHGEYESTVRSSQTSKRQTFLPAIDGEQTNNELASYFHLAYHMPPFHPFDRTGCHDSRLQPTPEKNEMLVGG
jgi:hypothetical protein